MDGQVKNLSGRSKEYASEVVNGRETYVLIRVESEWLVRAIREQNISQRLLDLYNNQSNRHQIKSNWDKYFY